jgi:hypothetical protein
MTGGEGRAGQKLGEMTGLGRTDRVMYPQPPYVAIGGTGSTAAVLSVERGGM